MSQETWVSGPSATCAAWPWQIAFYLQALGVSFPDEDNHSPSSGLWEEALRRLCKLQKASGMESSMSMSIPLSRQ